MEQHPEQRLFVAGRHADATSGKTFETANPANGDVLASVQQASQASAPGNSCPAYPRLMRREIQ
jgi:acyl-CoA reductase-like NAD-dependent aldehyde dehydrogenase